MCGCGATKGAESEECLVVCGSRALANSELNWVAGTMLCAVTCV